MSSAEEMLEELITLSLHMIEVVYNDDLMLVDTESRGDEQEDAVLRGQAEVKARQRIANIESIVGRRIDVTWLS